MTRPEIEANDLEGGGLGRDLVDAVECGEGLARRYGWKLPWMARVWEVQQIVMAAALVVGLRNTDYNDEGWDMKDGGSMAMRLLGSLNMLWEN